MNSENDKVLDFWNERATLVERAGSQDIIAKEIEINAIAKHIHNGMHVCEFGCGNGLTALSLLERFDINLDCYDFSPNMITEAKFLAEEKGVSQKINFYIADVRKETELKSQYDLIFTERMLINLDNWDLQNKAIVYLKLSDLFLKLYQLFSFSEEPTDPFFLHLQRPLIFAFFLLNTVYP